MPLYYLLDLPNIGTWLGIPNLFEVPCQTVPDCAIGRRLRIMKMSSNAKMGRYVLDGAAAAHSAQIKAAKKLSLQATHWLIAHRQRPRRESEVPP